jgi:predicted ATPase
MITKIEAKNFRSLKFIEQHLDNFHVLIGANASGKTTFLDVIGFISDIVKLGIDEAIYKRAVNFNDLTFSSKGGDIELAIEVGLPVEVMKFLGLEYKAIRYEISIGLTDETKEHAIKEERALLLKESAFTTVKSHYQRTLFPELKSIPASIVNKKYKATTFKSVIKKNPGGNDNFYNETYKEAGKGYMPSFKLGIKRSALGNLPADETKFPASTWLKSFLQDGVQLFILDSLNMRNPSAPGQSTKFKSDGSNLPWVIENLRKDPKKYNQWIEHLQTALPDIKEIYTVEREEDKKRYIKVIYNSGVEVPSWLISDGTLRLMALTIPAYLRDLNGVSLIEEPENGIHPKAIETVFLSLSSVYKAQILVASHSPVILGMVEPNQLLCFGKTKEGVTDIVLGRDHPMLKDWKGNPNLNLLFASGILS